MGCNWGNTNIPIDKSQSVVNPFTGLSDLNNILDYNNNGELRSGDNIQAGLSEVLTAGATCNNTLTTGNVCHNWYASGDWQDAFSTVTGNTKLSLSTNPASVPVYTYASNSYSNYVNSAGLPANIPTWENRTIWLNGLSIEILQENVDGNGAIKVKISWDNYNVENDVRWCGNIKLSPNDFDQTQPSLVVKSGKTLLLDRGKSPTQHKAYETVSSTGEKIFSEPTVLTCLSNSYVYQENNSTVIVDNQSTLKLKDNSLYEINTGATLHIKNYSSVIMENSSQLIVKSGGTLIIDVNTSLQCKDNSIIYFEPGSNLIINDNGFAKIYDNANMYYDGCSITLNGNDALLEITGTLNIAANNTFTFAGSGYMRFNSTLNPSTNIIAGANSNISFTGANINDKVLEILQDKMYIPTEIITFTLLKCKVIMGSNSGLQCNGLSTTISVNNTKITSDNGQNNSHIGLVLKGQQNVTINNSTFEYGFYGIFSYMTEGGNPLTVSNSTFRYCNYGLYCHDKGITLNSCFFRYNTTGLYSEAMSYASTITSSSFLNNETGVRYMGANTSSLYIKETAINDNTSNGLEVYGDLMVSVRCGTIRNNTYYGIYLSDAGLNLSTIQTPAAGKVNISKNWIAVGCDCAKFLYLEKGYNNFTPRANTYKPPWTIIGGVKPCLNNSITINASNNKWGNGNVQPEFNVNYNLYSCYQCRAWTNIYLSDNSPQSLTCRQQEPGTQGNQLNSYYVPIMDVRKINTASFNNEYLNIAVKQTKDLIIEEPLQTATFEELAKFHEILTYPVTNANESEKWLLDLSHTYNKSSFGSWKKNNLNETTDLSNVKVQNVLEVEDLFINNYIAEDDIRGQVHEKINKSQTYRIINLRDLAINELSDALVIADTSDLKLVNHWLCINQTEQAILNGNITNENALQAIEQCNSQPTNKSLIINHTDNNSQGKFSNENEEYINNEEYVNIYPNPSNGNFEIDMAISGNIKFEIFDITGRKVETYKFGENCQHAFINNDKLEQGTYLYTLFNNNIPIIKGKLIIVK